MTVMSHVVHLSLVVQSRMTLLVQDSVMLNNKPQVVIHHWNTGKPFSDNV